jgi:hypothetical protein
MIGRPSDGSVASHVLTRGTIKGVVVVDVVVVAVALVENSLVVLPVPTGLVAFVVKYDGVMLKAAAKGRTTPVPGEHRRIVARMPAIKHDRTIIDLISTMFFGVTNDLCVCRWIVRTWIASDPIRVGLQSTT